MHLDTKIIKSIKMYKYVKQILVLFQESSSLSDMFST